MLHDFIRTPMAQYDHQATTQMHHRSDICGMGTMVLNLGCQGAHTHTHRKIS